ncbi:hypothetical protein Hamer_G023018 [Homarus americanus]|uniref:Uncharacterized protein n=1 Tax=Homarus americanus TaxID=6706 RepID=A0A8J5JQW2_HOMAM|nr:hypothetical protein Hamer_G023018 [Homarus americanus]
MAIWRRVRNSMSVLLLLIVILYIGYCTEELYARIQNHRKLQRLTDYEKEIDELTKMLGEYKNDASSVQRSIKLLQEAFGHIKLNQEAKTMSDR